MTRWTTLGAVLAFGMVTLTPHPAHGMDDNDKAALAALLAVGVGVAAVASDKKDKHKNDWDHDRFGEPFSPAPGITCMPKVRQCYDGAMLSDTWTERVFGLGGSWASQHVSWGGSFKKSCGDIRTDDAGNPPMEVTIISARDYTPAPQGTNGQSRPRRTRTSAGPCTPRAAA